MEHSEYSKPENEAVRDQFITDFEYPDDEFYKDFTKETLYDLCRKALVHLDDFTKTVVFTKNLNPEMPLRDMAELLGVSHEKIRLKLIEIDKKYPFLFKGIDSHRRANYQRIVTDDTKKQKKTKKVSKIIKKNNADKKQMFLNI